MSVSSILDPSTGQIAAQFIPGVGPSPIYPTDPTFNSVTLSNVASLPTVLSSKLAMLNEPFTDFGQVSVISSPTDLGALMVGGTLSVYPAGPAVGTVSALRISSTDISYRAAATNTITKFLDCSGNAGIFYLSNVDSINGVTYPPPAPPPAPTATSVFVPYAFTAITADPAGTEFLSSQIQNLVPSGDQMLLTTTLNFQLATTGTPPLPAALPITDTSIDFQYQPGNQTFPLPTPSTFQCDPTVYTNYNTLANKPQSYSITAKAFVTSDGSPIYTVVGSVFSPTQSYDLSGGNVMITLAPMAPP